MTCVYLLSRYDTRPADFSTFFFRVSFTSYRLSFSDNSDNSGDLCCCCWISADCGCNCDDLYLQETQRCRSSESTAHTSVKTILQSYLCINNILHVLIERVCYFSSCRRDSTELYRSLQTHWSDDGKSLSFQ